MNHVAVDLGSRQSHFCIRSATGEILQEGSWGTATLSSLFATQEKSRIVLETSAEAFAVADMAKAAGHEVRVVPATLAPALGVGLHGVKTDKRDARQLSIASCRVDLGSVHIPSAKAREWKTLCTQRDALVKARTQLVNTVRGWMRMHLVKVKGCTPPKLPTRVREALGEEKIPGYLERNLKVLELLSLQITEADTEVKALAKEDEVCRNLMTVPGVGPVTAVRFRATLDEVTRFPSAAAVQSYLGLTPGEDSSSQRHRRTGITKAGSTPLRWVLVQSAWVAMRTAPNTDMVTWAKAIAIRRNPQIAAVALARKIAGILFAIWRDGTTYTPTPAK
jgi:transposase